MLPRMLPALACCFAAWAVASGAGVWATPHATAADSGQVTVTVGHEVNAMRPDQALGAGLDGMTAGDVPGVYTRRNVAAMRSAAFPSIAYRLRTELGSEAWHPVPQGSFSAGDRGYWTSAARPGRARLEISNGYLLPRRGNTIDQANNHGYSRVDDGSRGSFWKSNPYLDPFYAHERHDQWVMIDLGRPRRVDAVRIAWGAPYATRFLVQYWRGGLPPAPYGRERENAIFSSGRSPGDWHPFTLGSRSSRGGAQTVRVSRRPVVTQWVRILMTRSSHTAPPRSADIRDRLGYAIREAGVGTIGRRGFADVVHHGRAGQSIVWVSSTDPWHRSSDRDPNTEQPGFDRVWSSGLTRGRAVLMPVSMLYGTPEDAVAQLRWLRARGYPVRQVELGEEPDGQMTTPEDYGALYLRFAHALHAFDPHLVLGGPGFSTALPDWGAWPDRTGNRSFTGRFVRYLRAHHALSQLGFFSFEWYPVDDVCAAPAPQLVRAPALLAGLLARQHRAGLPSRIPEVITEFGYSAFAARPEAEMAGAISNADTVGQFFASGGKQAYLYGLEPQNVMQESRFCRTVGNLTLFKSDDSHRTRYRMATYWAARMVNLEWVQPGGAGNVVRATSTDDAMVSAYALDRPDGRRSLLVLNRDPAGARALAVVPALECPVDVFQLSPQQYRWHPRRGYPSPDGPPSHTVVASGSVSLPPSSVTVVRTREPARSCAGASALRR